MHFSRGEGQFVTKRNGTEVTRRKEENAIGHFMVNSVFNSIPSENCTFYFPE